MHNTNSQLTHSLIPFFNASTGHLLEFKVFFVLLFYTSNANTLLSLTSATEALSNGLKGLSFLRCVHLLGVLTTTTKKQPISETTCTFGFKTF